MKNMLKYNEMELLKNLLTIFIISRIHSKQNLIFVTTVWFDTVLISMIFIKALQKDVWYQYQLGHHNRDAGNKCTIADMILLSETFDIVQQPAGRSSVIE